MVGFDWVDLFSRSFTGTMFLIGGLILVSSFFLLVLRSRQSRSGTKRRRRSQSSEDSVEPAYGFESRVRVFEFHTSPLADYDERWKKLTRRELEIARLVAETKRNAAIAQELHLSERTVENHVQNIFRKLEIRSRGKLELIAQQFLDSSPQDVGE
jgi:DNA-binding NarL/FixJ family response regulator